MVQQPLAKASEIRKFFEIFFILYCSFKKIKNKCYENIRKYKVLVKYSFIIYSC